MPCSTPSFYTGVALLFQLVLGMLIALLLDSDRKGYGILRAMMTLPLVIPPAVTAMMFLLMLNGSFGVLSRGIIELGLLPPGFSILGNASTAMAGVLLAEIWQWTPFMVLIMLAGLRSLPKEPFEAAAIDGANAFQVFFKLTLPMMSKVIAIAVLIRGIDLFRIFDYVKVMTDSGPGTATETLTSYAGRIYFGNADFPYASTIALLTLDPRHHRLDALHEDLQGEALMELSRPWQILRDIVAVLVTGLFMFPILWWALTSIKPISAIFDKDRVVFFDFVPTWINYGVTMLGMSRSQLAIDQGIGMGVGGAEAYDSRQLDPRFDHRLGRLHGGDHGDRGARRLCAVAHGLPRPRDLSQLGSRASVSCRPSPSSFRW